MRYASVILAASSISLLALGASGAFAADPPGVVKAPMPAAASTLYLSVFGGGAFATDVNGHTYANNPTFPMDVPLLGGTLVGLAVGAHVMPNFRAEAEFSYDHRDSTGVMNFNNNNPNIGVQGGFSNAYAIANLWYDLDTGTAITPYIGVGAGFDIMIPDLENISGGHQNRQFITNAIAPVVQVGAGITYKLADNIAFDVGYRAKYVFDGSLASTTDASASVNNVSFINHSVQAGLTFGF